MPAIHDCATVSFLEFTTGEPHPLSSVHTVTLPLTPTTICSPLIDSKTLEAEVLGDYILVTAVNEEWQRRAPSELYLVSWKTGTKVRVSGPVESSFQWYPNFDPSLMLAFLRYGTAEGRCH